MRKKFDGDEDKIRDSMHDFAENYFLSKDGFTSKEFSTKVSQVMKKRCRRSRKMLMTYGKKQL